MSWQIATADVMAWAASYDGPKFHAMLCDPPYHLTEGKKGGTGPASLNVDSPAGRARISTGFMGRAWDGGDTAFNPDTWAALAEHLLPGAFGMAFASSRGWHRLACAIEDAGLRIHPTLFGWSFGSGFPKATRIPADGFDGHRYGGQALKPALEPIICFQKPYKGKPVDCITRTGAGALNIDAGRIGDGSDVPAFEYLGGNSINCYGDGLANSRRTGEAAQYGRWPSNLILLDDEAAARLDAQSGDNCGQAPISTSSESRKTQNVYGAMKRGNEASADRRYTDEGGTNFAALPGARRLDTGGASRFFYRVQHQLDEADPVLYCGKATRAEREEGLAGHTRQAHGFSGGAQQAIAGGEEYSEGQGIGLNRIRQVRNNHPTVKPIDLNRYLASLLLPPTKYAPRRILVPFGGVGSEAIGALLAGFEEAHLVEQSAEFVAIAEARLKHWTAQGILFARGAA